MFKTLLNIKMVVPLTKGLNPLNMNLYQVWIKFTSKCIICKDLSFQTYSLSVLLFQFIVTKQIIVKSQQEISLIQISFIKLLLMALIIVKELKTPLIQLQSSLIKLNLVKLEIS